MARTLLSLLSAPVKGSQSLPSPGGCRENPTRSCIWPPETGGTLKHSASGCARDRGAVSAKVRPPTLPPAVRRVCSIFCVHNSRALASRPEAGSPAARGAERRGPTTPGKRWPACLSLSGHGKGQRPPLKTRLCFSFHTGHRRGAEATTPSPLLPQKGREDASQRACGWVRSRAGHVWAVIPGRGPGSRVSRLPALCQGQGSALRGLGCSGLDSGAQLPLRPGTILSVVTFIQVTKKAGEAMPWGRIQAG